jgi:hypothetical protein
MNSDGAATPVTITYDTLTEANSAIAETDADGAMMRGYIHNTNAPLSVTLGGVPSGNVTFSSMSSLRNLPFEVICAIGLNDGSFPTSLRPAEFDLMALQVRRGPWR